MIPKRSIHEEGHKRKLLVVIDDTSECDRAIVYGAKRALLSNSDLVMVFVIVPGEFQHWLGVEQIMRDEVQRIAEEKLERALEIGRASAPGIVIQTVIREGLVQTELRDLISSDTDIGLLILAAGEGKEGPGPLVAGVALRAEGYGIPVTIVPSSITDEEIAALT